MDQIDPWIQCVHTSESGIRMRRRDIPVCGTVSPLYSVQTRDSESAEREREREREMRCVIARNYNRCSII